MPSLDSCALPLLVLLLLVAIYLIFSNQREGFKYNTSQNPDGGQPIAINSEIAGNPNRIRGINNVVPTSIKKKESCSESQKEAFSEYCRNKKKGPKTLIGGSTKSFKRAAENAYMHGSSVAKCGNTIVGHYDPDGARSCLSRDREKQTAWGASKRDPTV